MPTKKIAIGIGGASGSKYAKILLDKLSTLHPSFDEISVTMSTNAITNWELEIGQFDASVYPFRFFQSNDFFAPFASGSAQYDAMIIVPCSMGVLGRISSGVSNDLMTRGADVMLKERKKLILMVRETPFNLIHINNMKTVTEAGAIVCPLIPSFYSNPTTMDELLSTCIDRGLQLAGVPIQSYEWGKD